MDVSRYPCSTHVGTLEMIQVLCDNVYIDCYGNSINFIQLSLAVLSNCNSEHSRSEFFFILKINLIKVLTITAQRDTM